MKKALGAAIALLIVASPGMAAKKDVFVIEPGAAYVLVEVQSLDGAILKGVKMPGAVTLAQYDIAKGDIVGGGAGKRVTFFEKPFAKNKKSRQFLTKIEPATWVIEGASGTSFSLGSQTFVIKAGEIVDLGVMKPAVDWLEGEGPKSVMGGMLGAGLFGSMKPKETRPVRIDWHMRGAAGDMPLPAALQGKALVPVVYTPGAKFGNYMGGLVNRIGGRASRPGAEATAPAPAPVATSSGQ